MRKLFILVAASFLLVGCANNPQTLMAPIQYTNDINFHIPKNAVLYWKQGQQDSSESPTLVGGVGLPGLVVSAIDTAAHQQNPSRYTYTYGKAQQAIFITSLKNALVQHHVFNRTEIVTDLSKVKPQEILIKVHFKSARVLDISENYRIVLDVEMTIQTHKKIVFDRSYLATVKESSIFSGKNFKAQQTEVSQVLLNQLIGGIKAWHTHTN